MKLITRTRVTYTAVLAAGAAIGMIVVGIAAAAPAKVKTVTHYYSLAASAFAPDHLNAAGSDYFNEWDPATLSDNGSRCFNAGLVLPTDATLKSVQVFYTAGDDALYFEVNRQNLAQHLAVQLIHFDSTIATTPTYTITTKNFPSTRAKVNTSKFAYSIGVCPQGSSTFTGLTIRYTEPAG